MDLSTINTKKLSNMTVVQKRDGMKDNLGKVVEAIYEANYGTLTIEWTMAGGHPRTTVLSTSVWSCTESSDGERYVIARTRPEPQEADRPAPEVSKYIFVRGPQK